MAIFTKSFCQPTVQGHQGHLKTVVNALPVVHRLLKDKYTFWALLSNRGVYSELSPSVAHRREPNWRFRKTASERRVRKWKPSLNGGRYFDGTVCQPWPKSLYKHSPGWVKAKKKRERDLGKKKPSMFLIPKIRTKDKNFHKLGWKAFKFKANMRCGPAKFTLATESAIRMLSTHANFQGTTIQSWKGPNHARPFLACAHRAPVWPLL